ncbi:MAG: GldG family protein [Elusimicrobiota bacterium]
MKKIEILIFILILVILNLIVSKLNVRFDATRDKIYTLSKGSKNIIKKINDNLFIDLYYSKELPPQINTNKEYAISMIKDYASYSKKIKLSTIEIAENEDLKRHAREEGVIPVRFDIVSKEKFEQREGFLGLTIRYREKKDVIGFISDISNFEYDLTSRIKNLINENKEKVYFITDSNSLSSYRINPQIKEKLLNNYEIKDFQLKDLYNSTESFAACLVGPTTPLNEKELFYFDQILAKGNRIFIAYDMKYTTMDSFFSRDNNIGIEKILSKNGIRLKNTLILDRNSQAIQIGFRQGPFIISNIVKYPYFIITDNLDRNHSTTKDVYSLTIPFASPIEYSTTSKLLITPLVKTSRYSWAKKENSYININPFQEYTLSQDDYNGPFTISILAKGRFDSYFETVPKEIEKESKGKISHIKQGEKDSILYLISSSKFITNEELNQENAQYFTNIINFLTQDEDIITIRSKKAGFIPLKEINDRLKVLIKYMNIFLPSIILIAIGLYRWKKLELEREKAKKVYTS